MIEPVGYIIIRTEKFIEQDLTHPVNFVLSDNEDKFDNVADAIIERSKRNNPEQFIILPYW